MQDRFGVVELASRLVAIPSVTGNEGAVVAFLSEWLQEADLQVEVQEAAPGRPNLLAWLPAASGGRRDWGLLFHAHTDTVPEHGMVDAFVGSVEGGFLWGRGAVDQKGGLAAAAAALAAFVRRRVPAQVPVGLAAVIDEESEHRGSMALTQSGLRAQRAIVTEPSGLRVVVGCKGTVPLRIVVHGRAAHGCRPWLGLNAVEKAMLVAQKVLEMDLPEVELPDLGTIKATLNLGLVQGGVAYNIVPDCCELWFDRRTVPGEVPEAVVSEIRAVVDEIVAREPDLQAEVAVARPDWDWEPIAQRGLRATLVPPESDMPNWLAAHHERVHGHAPEWCFTDGYNEMDFLINDMGIPAVQYGPGDSHLCHTNEERLAISDLIMCTQVYSGLIEDAACREKMEMR